MERNDDMNIATYQATPEKHGNGTFFFTDCGHNMYSVRDDMSYHRCLYDIKSDTIIKYRFYYAHHLLHQI